MAIDNPLATERRSLRVSRSALTLVEVLVVILIIGILAASAIPALQTGLNDAQIREGARTASTILATARNRAIQTGRPVGVMLDPLSASTSGVRACDTMFYVEVPPPYAGDTISSTMTFEPQGDGTAIVSFPSGDVVDDIVQVGDQFQFNFQGHLYRIEEIVSSTTPITWKVSSGTAPALPTVPAPGVPFKFIRRPMKSSATPVTLPGAVVIDLVNSGIGDAQFNPTTEPILLLFTPTGRLELVYHDGATFGEQVESMVYFLVGRPGEIGSANLANLKSLWVGVGGRTGRVVTAENATYDGSLEDPPGTPVPEIVQRRAFARSGVSMGGR